MASTSTWSQDVQHAFDATLASRILDAGQKYQGELPALFGDIAKHVLSTKLASLTTLPTNAKKRKLDDAPASNQANGNGTAISNPSVAFECKNVSFAVPARKKLKLQLVADTADSSRREVRVLNAQSNEVEYTISNAQIEQAFCLPVPEKQQRQWNFVLFPQNGATNEEGMPCEQMVFTMNETKPDDASSSTRAVVEGDTYVSVTEPELNTFLQPYGKRVVKPTDAEFSSSIPQSHRKGEKAYHIKAHKGSKEGEVPVRHRCRMSLANLNTRLSFLTLKWSRLRLQETTCIFSFFCDRIHQLHIGSATNFQPGHRRHRRR